MTDELFRSVFGMAKEDFEARAARGDLDIVIPLPKDPRSDYAPCVVLELQNGGFGIRWHDDHSMFAGWEA